MYVSATLVSLEFLKILGATKNLLALIGGAKKRNGTRLCKSFIFSKWVYCEEFFKIGQKLWEELNLQQQDFILLSIGFHCILFYPNHFIKCGSFGWSLYMLRKRLSILLNLYANWCQLYQVDNLLSINYVNICSPTKLLVFKLFTPL